MLKKISFSETWQATEALVAKFVKLINWGEGWQAAETLGTQFISGAISIGAGLLRRVFTKQS